MSTCETAPNLRAAHQIAHGFCPRQDLQGASLNVSDKFASSPQEAEAARARAVLAVFGAPRPLARVAQIHSNLVHTILNDDDLRAEPKADALVTNRRELALGIVTADCAPVLFADPEAGVIAAAHAGWRGAVSGILAATLAAMQELGAHPHNMIAAIGPTISGVNYEVGEAFAREVEELNPLAARHLFRPPGKRNIHFDLPQFLTAELTRLDIGDVADLGLCTYGEPDRFYSHRRATHTAQNEGRQIALIGFNPVSSP